MSTAEQEISEVDGRVVRRGMAMDTMTVDGAVNKTLMLFGLMMVTTVLSWQMPSTFLMWTGVIGGLVLLIVSYMKPTLAPITAPGYALFEGLFIGSISAVYNAAFDGIVLQAVTLTFGTLLMMLVVYKTGIIKVTKSFKTGVFMATGAIMLMYVISIIGSFAGFSVPYLHDAGPIGIGISVVIIGIAALNLLIDFDAFEKGEQAQAPAYMEWLCAMGLIVTLVWLYIEILRLLSKLQRD
jgi:uncharacterized YccA/Bax inhibitor family protein